GTGTNPPNGSLSQQFLTTAGQQYQVSFLLAGNPDDGQGVKNLTVLLDSDAFPFVFDSTGKSETNMGWTPISFLWTAPTPGFPTFTFRGDTPTQYGAAVDAVSVDAVATPAPPALLLFASGLAGLGWLARRKRRASQSVEG